MQPSVLVSSIFKRFGGSFVNKNSVSSQRVIFEPALSRLGMELNGAFAFANKEIKTVVVWGKMECEFLSSLQEERKLETLKSILLKNPPLFLLSSNFSEVELIKKANEKWNENRSAIIKLDYSTKDIFTSVGTWLSKSLATWSTIHGSVVSVFGEGVLLTGEPGIGKTEVILDLLSLNHLFLGDDAIRVTRLGNAVIARANPNSSEFIQIRGIGLINIKEAIGRSKIIDESKINVIIELKSHKKFSETMPLENWGEEIKYKELLNVKIPHYVLPVQAGRNISELIQACVNDHKLKKSGYNSAAAFDKITKAHLIKSKK
ncbi:HPr(Ser) kinase/phosphatase [Mycoplasma suis]|uniref:HPr Serine kinase n=2 Tax=Mycoplasma suis TaxID=57372 RepID=F0QS84_MYCSL|nr:HPr(Ser) kinase/phosphatase [Mycoplasma suis]ADX98354.1 HPr Serine kinase [Mycoplasma suis str. Illinois]CBZ40863.1 HPr kinase/phosphorylase [Mycoplasma suis KI3806]